MLLSGIIVSAFLLNFTFVSISRDMIIITQQNTKHNI